jgi:hypothetical protein
MSILTRFGALLLGGEFDADWIPGWSYRYKITVDNTNIDSDLTHFPVPIVLGTSVGQSNQDVSDIFDELTSDANRFKIAITKSDGTTQIYGNIEHWDDANEKAVIHVAKSDLDITSASTTTLYIYYDSSQDDNTDWIGEPGKLVTTTAITGDNFTGSDDDPLDSDLWLIPFSNYRSTYSATIQSNKCAISLTGVNAANPDNVVTYSKFLLSGDFDIEIDFDSLINQSHAYAGFSFGVWMSDSVYAFVKADYISGNKFTYSFSGSSTQVSRTNDYGNIRIARSGSTITLYATDGGGSESELGSSSVSADDTRVLLRGWDRDSGTEISINFDNFTINSGTVKKNVGSNVYRDDDVLVHLMADDTTSTTLDSTFFRHHGDKTAANNPIEGDGPHGGKEQTFSGDGGDESHITINQEVGFAFDEDFSILAFVNLTGIESTWEQNIFVSTGSWKFLIRGGNDGSRQGKQKFTYTFSGDAAVYSSSAISTGTDTLTGISFNASTNAYTFYKNGTADGSGTTDITPTVKGGTGRLGGADTRGTHQHDWYGDIMYVRITRDVISAAEHKATYYALTDDLLTYGSVEINPDLIVPFELEYRIKPTSTGIWGSWTKVTTLTSDVFLSDSTYISANGVDETTALLTAPSGKTTDDFQTGYISDDINPISISLLSDKYTEVGFNLELSSELVQGDEIEFRITDEGSELDLYSVTPKITIGSEELFTMYFGPTKIVKMFKGGTELINFVKG